MTLFRKWLTNDDGATLIEYSLIVALLSVVLISILFTVGSDIANVFQKISTDVKG
ncbi:MAG: Flp family type IVb pilin [Parvibaculum sp.]